MKVPGEKGWQSVPEHTGKYTAEIGTVYARCVQGFVCGACRPATIYDTELKRLADLADLPDEDGTVVWPGGREIVESVSYTHLTLPTILLV